MLIQAVPTPAPPAPPGQPVTVEVVPRPGGGLQISTQGPTRPLTPREASIIREQRSEMSNQLTSAQGRREEILDELRDAPPGTEQGLREQYQVLSDRIVRIENDIEASGQMLRTGQVPAAMTIVPPREPPVRGGSDDAERGAAIAATIFLPIIALMLWKNRRRRRQAGRVMSEHNALHDERMERLEQAVDAIALEIERVGESQRYQARLLAEANLMPAMGGAPKASESVRARDFGG
ncbi:MAG TPA: hypothetical protein VFZ73_18275 [Gemmatimonadaceae bacterium]